MSDPPVILAIMDRLMLHMQAALAAAPGTVLKDDRHYGGNLMDLTEGDKAGIEALCRSHGYRADFGPGGLSGVSLSLTREPSHAPGHESRAAIPNP